MVDIMNDARIDESRVKRELAAFDPGETPLLIRLGYMEDIMRVLPREDEFLVLWQDMGGPPLEREVRFHPERKWRADFGCLDTDPPLLIEIEGGVWQGGRHNRPQGYIEDARKYNAAAREGYTVVRFTPDMFTQDDLQTWIDWCWDRL